MQIGKFNIRKWTYANRELANPILICWKLILFIPVLISLAVFCILVGLFNLDFEIAIETFKDNR